MLDFLRTRIDRQGRLYVPKRAGGVIARWNRIGDRVYVTLTDVPGREYRRYIRLIPASLLRTSFRGRWKRVGLRLERTRDGWFGSYKLLKGRGHADQGGR